MSDKRRAEASYSHRPLDLVRVAELEADLDAERRRNPAFELNWRNVLAWSEAARYETKTQVEAQTLYDAIMDGTNGVLQWVSRYW